MFAGKCLDNNIWNPLFGMSCAVSKLRVACGAESAATGPWSGLPGSGGGGLSTSNMLSTSPTLMLSTSRSSCGSGYSPGWPRPSLHPWLDLLSPSQGATIWGGSCTATGTAWFLELPFPTTYLSRLLFCAAVCTDASVELSTEGEGIELTAQITLCLHFSMASVKAVCFLLVLFIIVSYFNYTF